MLRSLFIWDWYYFVNIAALGEDDPIMRTGRGGQLNRSNAYRIVNRIYKRAGIRKKGLHLLRHTLATRLSPKGESTRWW